jgi:KDO2-lipid IV(A) lauroyltransferase
VVYQNLAQSLPELSADSRTFLLRRFYRRFTDNWVETIKLLSMSAASLQKRMSGNYELYAQLQTQGKPVQMVLGHFYNWEWLCASMALRQPIPLICVYMPISNSMMDRLFLHIRSRFGATLMKATTINKDIIPWRRKQYVIVLAADQAPSSPGHAYWRWFLHQPTAFVTGPERNAQVFQQAITYVSISQPRRGYYHFEFKQMPDEVPATEKGAVTNWIAAQLAADMAANPSLYLWSHRRWKHSWQPDYATQWIDERPMPA